jgi:hypothetical protein
LPDHGPDRETEDAPAPAPDLSQRLRALPPPVVVFNKSHSGSRLLAELLRAQGVFMGSTLNESLDATPFVPLVEYVVLRCYPDFGDLWRHHEWPREIQLLLATALDMHLAGHDGVSPWGWKLCETAYILPFLTRIFPGARYIHLIRDGRDVAFCDHVAPERAFWRKVYFGSDAVRSWNGMPLDQQAYERQSHLFNARHWRESVGLGRAFGAMLGPAYRELRYEALCADLAGEGGRLLTWLGRAPDDAALREVAARVHRSSIGKHRLHPRSQQRAVQAIIEPVLLACGYECDPLPPSAVQTARAFAHRIGRGLRRRLARSAGS